MLQSDFINMIRKLIESDVDQLVLFEVVKTFIKDLEPDPEQCAVCDYERYQSE